MTLSRCWVETITRKTKKNLRKNIKNIPKMAENMCEFLRGFNKATKPGPKQSKHPSS